MKSLKKIVCLVFYNICLSVSDYKFYTVILMLALIIHDYMKEIIEFSVSFDSKISLWVFPLLFNQKYMRRIIYIGILFLFCDLPVLKNNYHLILIRSRKKAWIAGQLVYIIVMSGAYYLIIFLISIIVNFSHIDFFSGCNDWGKIFETLGAGYRIGYKTYTSSIIIKYFTPLQASFFTFVLNWLSAVLIGSIICFMNIILKGNYSGVAVSTMIVLADSLTMYYPDLIWISPASWSNLEFIKISSNSNLPSIEYVFVMYIVLITVVMICNVLYYLRSKTELQ